MKNFVTGVDVGNYDTKTPNDTTNSGYKVYQAVPYGADEVLTYNGNVYVPTLNRFPYVKDKTVDERCFMLTLIGIAKEILDTVKPDGKTDAEIQKEISEYTDLYLGVGLPPLHMSTLSEKLIEYYKKRFGENVSFNYKGYDYSLNLKVIRCYPQDFAAVMTHTPKNDNFITKKFKTYYAIDIGGYTVDVVPIHDGRPQVEGCRSLDMGVLKMYSKITDDMNRNFGISITYDKIEDVLRGEPTILSDAEIIFIHNAAQAWLDEIINRLREDGLEFDSNPVVFIGGGSKLFKKYIKANKIIRACDFITNPRANALGYKKLLMMEMKTQGR